MKKKSFLKMFIVVTSISFFTFIGCKKENTSQSNENLEEVSKKNELNHKMVNIASYDEYKNLNDNEKKVVDLINSSINGLIGLSLNSKGNLSDYVATFHINLSNSNNLISDYVLITKSNPKDNVRVVNSESCTACGMVSGIKCAKRILQYIEENGLSDLTVHIHVNGDGCYEITWGIE